MENSLYQEAYARTGISPQQLQPIPPQFFASKLKGSDPQIINLHIRFHEKQRRKKLNLVKAEIKLLKKQKKRFSNSFHSSLSSPRSNIMEHQTKLIKTLQRKQTIQLEQIKQQQHLRHQIEAKTRNSDLISQQREKAKIQMATRQSQQREQKRKRDQKLMWLKQQEQKAQYEQYQRKKMIKQKKNAEFLQEREQKRLRKAKQREEIHTFKRIMLQETQNAVSEQKKKELNRKLKEMEKRDKIRLQQLNESLQKKQLKNQSIRLANQLKFKAAKQQYESLLKKKRKDIQQRESRTEATRKQFELIRQQTIRNKEEARHKRNQQEVTAKKQKKIEEKRQKMYRESQERAQIRLYQQQKQAIREKLIKKQEEKIKQQERKAIRQQIQLKQTLKLEQVKKKLKKQSKSVQKTRKQKQRETKLKQEKAKLLKLEKQAEIERLRKIEQYKKSKIRQRLSADQQRIERLLYQKQEAQSQRYKIKEIIQKKKAKLNSDFKLLKQKTIKSVSVQATPLKTDSYFYTTRSSMPTRQNRSLSTQKTQRRSHQKPIKHPPKNKPSNPFYTPKQIQPLNIQQKIKLQQTRQVQRTKLLSTITNKKEKKRLERIFGVEREKASVEILNLIKSINQGQKQKYLLLQQPIALLAPSYSIIFSSVKLCLKVSPQRFYAEKLGKGSSAFLSSETSSNFNPSGEISSIFYVSLSIQY